MLLAAVPCDQYGNDLPPNAPPPPLPERSPDDWTPYGNRADFEFADFIYRRNQMSATDIDVLLDLWASKVFQHGDSPPFATHNDLYDTIDASPLGDVPWQSFTVNYTGQRPERGRIPPWMGAEFEVWFRDPLTIVHNLLANPEFDRQFDYTPMQEFMASDSDSEADNRRFKNFFSGDWVWEQAVNDPLLWLFRF
jgi:Plavaka transposase